MKLWIDDFRDAPDDSWTEVRKVEEAIRLAAHFSWDVISIDHDIENRPDDETFKPVAYFIGQKAEFWRQFNKHVPKVIVHSDNPVGARQIIDILGDYGVDSTWEPFTSNADFKAKYGL